MAALAGLVLLFVCVFGTYVVEGGSIGPVMEALPFEFATIGGAAIASFIVANSMFAVRHTLHNLRKVVQGAMFVKRDYVDLLSLLFFFVRLANTKGAMALEAHIERPKESAAFKRFPKILANGIARSMICDYFRMVGMNDDDPHQIEDVMARELRKTLQEELHPAHALQVVADALPAFGIVAAVLGVVQTMGHIAEPPVVLGRMIGEALTGTFLGVFLAYGIAAPIAARLQGVAEEEAKYFEVIRAVLVAHLHGNAPQVSVETGRKMAPNQHMPSFTELEAAIQALKIQA